MTITFESDAEATNAIKKALRQKFPDAAFSVTRGGMWIKWEDVGPTVEQVKPRRRRSTISTLVREAAEAAP
jgi:hypothetical protein